MLLYPRHSILRGMWGVPQVYDVDLMMILDFGTSESTIYGME